MGTTKELSMTSKRLPEGRVLPWEKPDRIMSTHRK